MRCRATPNSATAKEQAADKKQKQQTPRTVIVPEDVVFNPDYQGKCVGNRSISQSIRDTIFVPPEQLRFSRLQGAVSGAEKDKALDPVTADGVKVGFWNLSQAVQILCDLCNRDETNIKNPLPKDLDALLGKTEALLRGHKQPLGKYLPEQLDLLLRPYGFDWNVDYLAPGDRRIRVFARGRGKPGLVKLQPSFAPVDMDQSNAEVIDVTADISSRCVNEFRVLGDHLMVEATFELVPAWPKATDEATDIDLIPAGDAEHLEEGGTNPKWLAYGDENTSRTWRDWVLNEAGDYDGERKGIRKAFDLAQIIGPCVSRRRKFEPTITLGTDGNPIGSWGGITIEWFDSADGEEGKWKDISTLQDGRTVKILDHECGIRFDGDLPPTDLMVPGIDPKTEMPKNKIRVTASIRADARLEIFARSPSPLDPQVNTETIDVGSRFKLRVVDFSSIYWEKVDEKKLHSSQLDDREDARKLGQQLLANWNQASVNGTLTLTGCAYRTALGRPIAGIQGRDIDFRTTAAKAAEARYPIVVGQRYDFQSQTVSMVLDTFRGETV
jgi:hypothetical protein